MHLTVNTYTKVEANTTTIVRIEEQNTVIGTDTIHSYKYLYIIIYNHYKFFSKYTQKSV